MKYSSKCRVLKKYKFNGWIISNDCPARWIQYQIKNAENLPRISRATNPRTHAQWKAIYLICMSHTNSIEPLLHSHFSAGIIILNNLLASEFEWELIVTIIIQRGRVLFKTTEVAQRTIRISWVHRDSGWLTPAQSLIYHAHDMLPSAPPVGGIDVFFTYLFLVKTVFEEKVSYIFLTTIYNILQWFIKLMKGRHLIKLPSNMSRHFWMQRDYYCDSTRICYKFRSIFLTELFTRKRTA